MKKIAFMAFLLSSLANVAFSQSPEMFNYQAVIRDNESSLVVNQPISFRINILSGSVNGTSVYSEIHQVTTGAYGGIVLQIGSGQVEDGVFSEIEWGNESHFIQTAIDLDNGTNFSIVSTTQFLSVPYALYAKSSGDKVWSNNDQGISYDQGNVGINTVPQSDLDIVGDDTDDDIIAIRNNNYARYAAYGASNTDEFAIPLFVGFKSRGTIDSPQNVASQDRVTGLYGGMYVGNEYRVSSAVEMFAGNNIGNGSYPSYIKFGTTSENGTARQERMRIDQNGNIGIGTVAPNYELDVSGKINAEEYLINGQPISLNQSIWSSNNDDIFYNVGNVGINTSSPEAYLDVEGNGTDDDMIAIRNNDYSRFAAYGASNSDRFAIPLFVGFKSRGTTDNPQNVASQDRVTGLYGGMYVNNEYRVSSAVEMFAGNNIGSGSYPSYIKFGTTSENGTSREERMRIDQNGNIGIGTQNPSSKLQVSNGDVYIDDINSGVIMISPNGQCWRMTIDNSGQMVTSSIVCPD